MKDSHTPENVHLNPHGPLILSETWRGQLGIPSKLEQCPIVCPFLFVCLLCRGGCKGGGGGECLGDPAKFPFVFVFLFILFFLLFLRKTAEGGLMNEK